MRPIEVSPQYGKFLYLLASAMQARRILEIGTLGGFSTIWLARAVGPSGHVVTLEREPKHADVARANLDRAGVGERVEVIVGAALDTLPQLATRPGREPFDLVFVDADKENNVALRSVGYRPERTWLDHRGGQRRSGRTRAGTGGRRHPGAGRCRHADHGRRASAAWRRRRFRPSARRAGTASCWLESSRRQVQTAPSAAEPTSLTYLDSTPVV